MLSTSMKLSAHSQSNNIHLNVWKILHLLHSKDNMILFQDKKIILLVQQLLICVGIYAKIAKIKTEQKNQICGVRKRGSKAVKTCVKRDSKVEGVWQSNNYNLGYWQPNGRDGLS